MDALRFQQLQRLGGRYVAMAVFLHLNDWRLDAPEADVVRMMLAVAAGKVSEAELPGWVRAHLQSPK